MSAILHAVIYVTSGPAARQWVLRGTAHAERRGYEVVAVVIDDGDGWASVRRLLDDGRAEVVVVPKHQDPPPDRVPRIEYLENAEEGPALSPQQRRPRLIPRGGEG